MKKLIAGLLLAGALSSQAAGFVFTSLINGPLVLTNTAVSATTTNVWYTNSMGVLVKSLSPTYWYTGITNTAMTNAAAWYTNQHITYPAAMGPVETWALADGAVQSLEVSATYAGVNAASTGACTIVICKSYDGVNFTSAGNEIITWAVTPPAAGAALTTGTNLSTTFLTGVKKLAITSITPDTTASTGIKFLSLGVSGFQSSGNN